MLHFRIFLCEDRQVVLTVSYKYMSRCFFIVEFALNFRSKKFHLELIILSKFKRFVVSNSTSSSCNYSFNSETCYNHY